MPLSKLKKKPCSCPKENFQWVKTIDEKLIGKIKKIHSYEIKKCSFHNFKWGSRRNEEILFKCYDPINNLNLNQNELIFFREVFTDLWNGYISEKKWINSIEKILKVNSDFENISSKYIQLGLIYKKIQTIQSSNSKKCKIIFTDFGKSFLKEKLEVLTPEDQINLTKAIITESLQKKEPKNEYADEFHEKLGDLLNIQLKLISQGKPYWKINENSYVYPEIAIKRKPTYLIMSYTLSKWFEIYRPSITLRELSCRTFSRFPIRMEKDPSKILIDNFKHLSGIIKSFSTIDIEEFGLIKTLENFEFSGSMIVEMQDGKKNSFVGPSFALSNVYLLNIKYIYTPFTKMLFVENSAMLAQIALDNWALENETLVIYNKGNFSPFIEKILKNLSNNNPTLKIWMWVDHDLGGCKIYERLAIIFQNHLRCIIKIPDDFDVPFSALQKQIKDKICLFFNNSDEELTNYAKSIYSKGTIEQEFFLGDYQMILNNNGICEEKNDKQE